ncbi:MAG TPA: FmdB family zinc ribbon protein [Anaerolineaceae bacterium]|nr:FmdB family zinc ribbon protein [Anaerolineaceae bacterium]
MPVYMFVCQECGQVFEKYLSFDEASNSVSCPNGHTNVLKKLSKPAVVFKGKGFYVTDHRTDSPSTHGEVIKK